MFDDLAGRRAGIVERHHMRLTIKIVDEDEEMAAIDFTEVSMDLLERTGGWLPHPERLWRQ